MEARNYKCCNTFEFNKDLSIALSSWDWAIDDPNALWKQFSDKFKLILMLLLGREKLEVNMLPGSTER